MGMACIETSLVDDIFSLHTESDLTEIVPRLSLPLMMEINEETRNGREEKRREYGVREKVCKSIRSLIVRADSLSWYHEVVEESELAV
jgi:hypothetical protein